MERKQNKTKNCHNIVRDLGDTWVAQSVNLEVSHLIVPKVYLMLGLSGYITLFLFFFLM